MVLRERTADEATADDPKFLVLRAVRGSLASIGR
jgi:hypothetical protein